MGFLNPKKAAQDKIEEIKGRAKAVPGNVARGIATATCEFCGRTRPKTMLQKHGTGHTGGTHTHRGKSYQKWICKNGKDCRKHTGSGTTHRRGKESPLPMDDE